MVRNFALAAVALAIAGPVHAQSAWDGTWKIDTAQAKPTDKPLTVKLAGGTYECDCVPPIRVAADGKMHPLKGDPYADALAVTVVDPRTVRMDWGKGGKVVETVTTTLGADDNTSSYQGTETTGTGAQVAFSGTRTRIAAAPAGAHALSGQWRGDPGAKVSDAGLTYTIATTGDAVTMTTGTGERFTAKLGGPWVRIVGDIGGSEVKLARNGDRGIRQTFRAGGKERAQLDWTLAADGRSANVTNRNLLRGSQSSIVLVKQ